MMGGQILIIFVGGQAFNIAKDKQTGAMWAYALILGVISIPVGMIIRLIPDTLVERLVPDYIKRRAHKAPDVTVSDDERFEYFPPAFAEVRDELAFLKQFKGGRINNLKFAMKHPRETFMPRRSASHSRSNSKSNSIHVPMTPVRQDSTGATPSIAPPTPDSRRRSRSTRSRSNSALGASMVMTGIIAGSVAGGWAPSPVERRPDSDFGVFPPKSSPHAESEVQHSQRSLTPSINEEQETPEIPRGSAEQTVPILSVPKPPGNKSA